MKKLVFLLLASIFLSLNFTSCADLWNEFCEEFGIKTVDGDIYLSLPDGIFTLYIDTGHGMKKFFNRKEVSFEEVKELQENYPKETFFKEKKDNEILYKFSFSTEVPVRRNYSFPLEVEFSDKDYFCDIDISFFKDEGEIFPFSLSTENNEILKGVFIYEFHRSI